MPTTIVPVILCGGAGSRLWPVSRQLLPKQFLPLVTGQTLLQDTALRAKEAADGAQMLVICNEAHRFLVQDQLTEIGIAARILLEPAGRSTAAAVAVAGLACEKADPVLLILASDHAIRGSEAFKRAVRRAPQVAVSPAEFEWSDVGSWEALWELAEKDAAGNAARGDVQLQDTKDSLVFGDRRLIATLGVEDLIIVDTDDALLVADRARSQEVREVVEDLKRANRSEHLSHRRVYRPWGYFESVDNGERYQVKRLMVKPGHALSLQLHRKRAEHRVVLSGRARVTRGEDTLYLEENQSTYIPVGTRHRLENAGSEPLLIIEVQSGSYLGEDDIERFEDRYNRS